MNFGISAESVYVRENEISEWVHVHLNLLITLCLDGVDQQGPGTLVYNELTLNTGISRPALHLQVSGWETEAVFYQIIQLLR